MIGSVQAWFIVEATSLTHDFFRQGGSLSSGSYTTEWNNDNKAYLHQ
ncbi:hypothetical protein [Brevibacillus sp. SYSU BS000544]